METFYSGVPAPFCKSASVSAVTASHPFGGGNAGVRMECHDVMDALACAVTVWTRMENQPHEANIGNCKRALIKAAHAITQLWDDVLAEEGRRTVGQKALA